MSDSGFANLANLLDAANAIPLLTPEQCREISTEALQLIAERLSAVGSKRNIATRTVD